MLMTMSSDRPPTHLADTVRGWSTVAVLVSTPVTATIVFLDPSQHVIVTALAINSVAGLPLLAALLAGRGLPEGEQPGSRDIARSFLKLAAVVAGAFALAFGGVGVPMLVFGLTATWKWWLWPGGRRRTVAEAVRQPASLKLPHHVIEAELASALPSDRSPDASLHPSAAWK